MNTAEPRVHPDASQTRTFQRPADPLLQVCGLRVEYRHHGSATTAVDGIDLSVGRGEIVALVGESGSGKSTLLRTLAGIDEAPAGTVRVPAERAVVFQTFPQCITSMQIGFVRSVL